MRPMHEQILEAVHAERRRLSSRRGFVAGGAKLAGGGALALAFAGAPGAGALRSALAQEFEDDVDVLNYALTLEHLEYAFYRDGLEEFGEDGFAEAGRPASVFTNLEMIRDHEQAHVEALTAAVEGADGKPVEEQEYDFGYEDVDGFLEVAMALENTGVAAYAGAAPAIENADILAAALGIHSVEARHAAYLNIRNEESPFPAAVDEALTREEVLEIAGPFITS